MEQTDKTIKNTQKILNKLISEEVIAANIYMGAINNVKPECLKFIEEKFSEIAKDEIVDLVCDQVGAEALEILYVDDEKGEAIYE